MAVTSLVSSEPIPGVELEIYNYQNQLVEVKQTGPDGMVTIPLEQKPFLLIARNGSQRGYLKLDDGSALSTSMFDVAGNKNSEGIKGFFYGERGVWRPGDSIYMTFVLEDKNEILPDNHPVRFELFTPESQLYLNRTRSSGLNGVYDFRCATGADAPTGNWLAKVTVGGSTFSRPVKIETVKPNRLKINLDFGSEVLKKGQAAGTLNALWLHGAIARNLKADIALDLRSTTTSFKEHQGFVFDDPVKDFESEEVVVFEGRLDEQGSASFLRAFRWVRRLPGCCRHFSRPGCLRIRAISA